MTEAQRLLWVRTYQKELKADLYQGLIDALLTGERSTPSTGKRIILPSFLHSWQEVTRLIENESLSSANKPEILCRVFHMKLKALMDTIKKKKIFGTVIIDVHTIEFQKRGLPHAHILLFLNQRDQPKYSEDVDKVISAEIPNLDEEPQLYDLVKRSLGRPIDEIQQYYNFRYISACEAAWHIFAFDIHHKYLAVERLSFHLPNQQCVVYSNADDIKDLLNKHCVWKTFLWNALASTLRARGDIVITIASSGIAATLLPFERIAHS
ncbi:uncharacterized protein LOC114743628, partial [Neltuma alba]|uniref:uncharacterized protein LOC114743628 n=1 Tax=Neltuma alba TaxID=207710 RepID=UPI0010A472B9